MARIIANPSYDASADKDGKQTGKYLFENEGKQTPMWVWLEKKAAFAKTHPNGKPWLRSKEMLEACNRDYISESAVITEIGKAGYCEVAVKTAAKRVIGATGVQQGVVKYLSPESAAGYTALVTKYTEAFKAAKGTQKKKKLEEMNAEELKAYIAALESGEKPVVSKGPKNFIEIMTAEDVEAYNAYIAEARDNKENAPKVKAERKPLTDAEKAARAAKRVANEKSKAQQLLAAMLGGPVAPAAEDTDEDFDDSDDTDETSDDEDFE